MVKWTVKYTKRVASDAIKLQQIGLKEKTQKLIDLISENPYQVPPSLEKLIGFKNVYSRRINIKHRLVYEILEDIKTIKIISIFGHYSDN